MVHYGTLYLEYRPLIITLNGIIDDPSVENLVNFRASIQGTISPYAGEIFLNYNNFIKELNQLIQKPESQALIESARGFVIDYKQYMLSRPNVIGASGAVFGILLAFGMLFPNVRLYLYFFLSDKSQMVRYSLWVIRALSWFHTVA